MSKAKSIKEISEATGESKECCSKVFDAVISDIIDTVVRDGRMVVPMLGIFKLKYSKERNARNPFSGELVKIPAKVSIKFKPSADLKNVLREIDPVVYAGKHG